MIILDKNIKALQNAASELERKITETELTADESVSATKNMMEYINTAGVLIQIRTAIAKNSPIIKNDGPKIVTM